MFGDGGVLLAPPGAPRPTGTGVRTAPPPAREPGHLPSFLLSWQLAGCHCEQAKEGAAGGGHGGSSCPTWEGKATSAARCRASSASRRCGGYAGHFLHRHWRQSQALN